MKTLFILLSFSFLLACGSSSQKENATADADMTKADYAKKEVTPSIPTAGTNDEVSVESPIDKREQNKKEEPKNTTETQKGTKYPKKLIREANLVFQVENFKTAQKEIQILVNKSGGYISNEKGQNDNYQLYGEVEIRVPVEKFDTLLSNLEKKGKKLDTKEIKVIDITADYYDTETRLNTKKTFENRYLELLKQAKNINEILAVEAQIRALREEIESKEGQLRLWNDKISYSTIFLKFYEKLDYKYIPSDRPSFFNRIVSSLDEGWSGFLNLIVVVITLWPLWIIVFVLTYLIRRYRRLRKKNTASKEAIKI